MVSFAPVPIGAARTRAGGIRMQRFEITVSGRTPAGPARGAHSVHRLGPVLVLALLAGCATALPSAIREPIPGGPEVAEARANLKAQMGKRVRWGGTIVRLENRRNETWLEVVARELERGGRPRAGSTSGGRFLARVTGFLDPAVYAAGRLATVAGVLEGESTRAIGDFPYTYAVVRAEAVHLWEPLPERGPGYYDPFWNDPWYPWGHPWGYPYYRR